MAKKKAESKWEPDTDELTKILAALPGMNQELAGRIVNDGDWPAEAGVLAAKYGLSQMDAEGVLRVLNANRS